jgi:hypothetical protein
MSTNLHFIERINVTSSTSALNVDNVFTDAYENYKIFITGMGLVGSTQTALYIRMIDESGVVETATNYDYSFRRYNSGTTFSIIRSTTANFFNLLTFDKPPENQGTVIDIFNTRSATHYTNINASSSTHWDSGMSGYTGIGTLHLQEKHRGFQVLEPNVRPFDEGSVFVYGVK